MTKTLALALGDLTRPEWQQAVHRGFYRGHRWAVATDGHRLHAERCEDDLPKLPDGVDLATIVGAARRALDVDVGPLVRAAKKWIKPSRRMLVDLRSWAVRVAPYVGPFKDSVEPALGQRMRAAFEAEHPEGLRVGGGPSSWDKPTQTLDARYLAEAVRHVGTSVVWAPTDELAPVLLEQADRLALVMPVRP